MICVSIARGRHRHVIAEHRHVVEQGAKLVELRIDYLEGPANLKRLLADRPSPVVVTCRRERDGGKFKGDEATRLILLRTAVAEGADYVDLEEDVAASIPRYGKTKRIVSLHDFRRMPDDLEAIHARLATLDADIVKLAVMANQPHDNLRMLTLIQKSQIPTVGLCMGDIGTPSRILAGRYGAPFSFATFHHERTLAPGQLSYDQMTRIYHYEQINAETAIFAVIGDPVGHSLSPIIHNAAIAASGLNAVYLPFRVPREHLGRFIDEAPQFGIRGLSVTIPHKEAVMSKLTRVDAIARGIGAVNTVLFKDRDLIGYNTDEPGAMAALEEALAGDGTMPGDFNRLNALVLGSGGAAMALAYGMKRRGIDVAIAGRSAKPTEAMAERLHCRAIDWNDRHEVHADILVNCTPVGMHPNVDATPFDKEHLRATMLVFDTVYNPENTLLIKEARERGCTVVTGLEMFVRQAALQFKLFTGQEGPMQLMREELKRAIGPAKY